MYAGVARSPRSAGSKYRSGTVRRLSSASDPCGPAMLNSPKLEVFGVAGDDQVPVRSVDRPRPCSHANCAVQADKVFRVWLHADPEAFLDHGEPEVAPLR